MHHEQDGQSRAVSHSRGIPLSVPACGGVVDSWVQETVVAKAKFLVELGELSCTTEAVMPTQGHVSGPLPVSDVE